jgi:hypothetical protein
MMAKAAIDTATAKTSERVIQVPKARMLEQWTNTHRPQLYRHMVGIPFGRLRNGGLTTNNKTTGDYCGPLQTSCMASRSRRPAALSMATWRSKAAKADSMSLHSSCENCQLAATNVASLLSVMLASVFAAEMFPKVGHVTSSRWATLRA